MSFEHWSEKDLVAELARRGEKLARIPVDAPGGHVVVVDGSIFRVENDPLGDAMVDELIRRRIAQEQKPTDRNAAEPEGPCSS
jgi:hypothetical protein